MRLAENNSGTHLLDRHAHGRSSIKKQDRPGAPSRCAKQGASEARVTLSHKSMSQLVMSHPTAGGVAADGQCSERLSFVATKARETCLKTGTKGMKSKEANDGVVG